MIKVMLIDDYPVVRSGITHLIESERTLSVVAETDNIDEGYKLYFKTKPDVLILDLDLLDSSLGMLNQLITKEPKAKVMIFSSRREAMFAIQSISAGAKGYVLKSSDQKDIIHAIQQINKGQSYISPEVAQEIALQKLHMGNNPMENLTTREFEVFRLLAEGANIDMVASKLKIGYKTAANYQTILKQKLNISSPFELIRLALKHRVITINLAFLPFIIAPMDL
jgi:DNA-binding NarL/FixJ family response regulator